ncbi:hypothetical protein Clacol_009752 [Clathrus columnatus]|uniref:Fungal-type protein kinase domain-containing protein n=1 Tax=Clathrus columnatus TaxID=1419009 RepID=A0AAV5ARU7_9AGAM|nr:hypothetical protein Clacol_009752 [Clathrus columnatus]
MFSPCRVSSSAQSYAGDPRTGGHSTQSFLTIIKEELEGKLEFDQPNVLHRLRIQDVDDELVNQIGKDLENDESFVESKITLNKLFNSSGNDGENAVGEKKNQYLEDKMMTPLSQIFDRVVQLAVANDNERERRYERKWLANADQPLRGRYFQDGVQFSPIHDLWDNIDVLIRIIRRMTHEMSPVDFDQDPNVNVLPNKHPNSVTCHNIATALAKGNSDLIKEVSNYPTYSINFCNVKYFTIGFPVWNSLSLLGRGTSIWRVLASPTESFATDKEYYIIPVPSLFNPNRVREMSVPTTRTHTTWTPPPRGAVLTGTIQFMALELVSSISGGSQPIHHIYHDVESFIWVTYYGILRRIGYVGRNLTGEAISAGLRNTSQIAFKKLFNHVDPDRITLHLPPIYSF